MEIYDIVVVFEELMICVEVVEVEEVVWFGFVCKIMLVLLVWIVVMFELMFSVLIIYEFVVVVMMVEMVFVELLKLDCVVGVV